MTRSALGMLFVVLLTSGPASGQGIDVSGQWYCKHSMEPFSGNAYDKHYWEYTLLAQPGGTFQLEGFYYGSVVGSVPVQAQGQYGMYPGYGGALVFKGTMYQAGSGSMPYELAVHPADASNMYFQFRGNTHFHNATCSR